MPNWLQHFFKDIVLKHPWMSTLFVLAVILSVSSHVVDFRMDASADSLILENDSSLEFYRKVKKTYGTDDYLFVTFQPNEPLFSKESINQLKALRDQIAALKDVETVISLVDAPIFDPENVSLTDIENQLYFIGDENVNLKKAQSDILSIPLYRNLLISKDGQTTAIQANLKGNANYFKLNDELRKLQWKKRNKEELTPLRTSS